MTTRSTAAPPEPAAPAKPKLAPLCCPECGSAVPLGDGAEARCAYCGAKVPVPPEYTTLRVDAQARADDLGQLDGLYAEASRPPAKALSLWAFIGTLAALVAVAGALILTAVTVIAVIVIELRGPGSFGDSVIAAVVAALWMVFLSVPAFIETFCHLLGSHGRDLADALGPWFGVAVGIGAYVLLAVPAALGAFAESTLDAVARLRAALRADKPLHPGGPAICRSCGAALDVPPGALGVRCIYCRSDNLVALPADALAAEKKETADLHREVGSALDAHRAERAAIRRRLIPRLAWGVVCVPVFAALYFPAQWVTADGHAGPAVGHRASERRGVLWPLDAGKPIPELARDAGATEDTLAFPDVSCADRSGDQCTAYLVSLERGDRVFLVASEPLRFGFDDGRSRPGHLDDLRIELQRHAHGFGACAGDAWVDDLGLGQPVPYTGWYRLQIRGPAALARIDGLHWTTHAELSGPAPLPESPRP